ncbi:response regulator transcription factor [Paenibacillus sp. CAA11]|uniref:response regulator transcription factor n=1 Tax=Paenibacillus sp. CAA11 TaxID=1532905 RepID=UPI001F34D381|nr:response regulator [Paenibacillus sp. CAA11]
MEDEPRMREGLKKIIAWEEHGFLLCNEAENGRQALQLIKAEKPELVITDIRLPGVSGLELMKEITEVQDTCFVVISGYDDFDYVKTALVCGAVDYILKPIEEEQLISALHRVKKRLGKELLKLPQESVGNVEDPIESVKQYVKEHFYEQITMKELAGKMYLHPFYLGQLFRKSTGLYFNDYVHQIRIEEAKQRLIKSACKIADIAATVGYNDTDYFVQQFKKNTGCTPSAYRKQSSQQ